MSQYYTCTSANASGNAPILPAGMQRETMLNIIDRAGEYLNLGNASLRVFRRMAGYTKPSHFTRSDREPVCYVQQVELAKEFGITTRQLRTIEANLVNAQLIDKRTMANGARAGFCDTGIFFTPAIARIKEIAQWVANKDAERAEMARLRGRRSCHKRHLAGIIEDIRSENHLDEMAAKFESELESWPDARDLHRMTLADLKEHEAKARQLCRKAEIHLINSEKNSPREEENFRPYIQDTTQDYKKSCTVNGEKRTARYRAETVKSECSLPKGREQGYEYDYNASNFDHKNEFLEKLTHQRLYNLCSNEMQYEIDIERRSPDNLTPRELELAALNRCRDLGINHSAWQEAADTMGHAAAILAIILTDANVSRHVRPVKNPGGYLRGLTRSAREGNLNIMGGLIALSERRKREALRDKYPIE